jgi:hypothetical protein
MKTRTKRILHVISILLCLFVGFCAFGFIYNLKYAHQHCIKLTGLVFYAYAQEHGGQLPFSTNGFGNALLLLTKGGYLGGTNDVTEICGPDDDGHIFKEALTNNSVVPEDQCSRVYI